MSVSAEPVNADLNRFTCDLCDGVFPLSTIHDLGCADVCRACWNRVDKCTACGGSGIAPTGHDTDGPCRTCEATGQADPARCYLTGYRYCEDKCAQCDARADDRAQDRIDDMERYEERAS